MKCELWGKNQWYEAQAHFILTYASVACAKFCTDHYIKMFTAAKLNCHKMWIMRKKSSVIWGSDPLHHNQPSVLILLCWPIDWTTYEIFKSMNMNIQGHVNTSTCGWVCTNMYSVNISESMLWTCCNVLTQYQNWTVAVSISCLDSILVNQIIGSLNEILLTPCWFV